MKKNLLNFSRERERETPKDKLCLPTGQGES